ncbi:hypothetical protein FZEAL_6311 [Fusarium zealandicum]|uniref:BZIP domain-containing protein n=1 Tax=Fusarium zealandicum TaxID=1053134 RepID=A0A8H4UIT4_9HYPO|nr:hypothetical protein FZEAL_6311 [Fusarium zealandicum]
MTAQSSLPAKRRGRPSSNSQEVDEATLKARRERNREAQNIFRRRRQAAEAAQAKRVRRLEEIIEEMSSIFMTFVDEMLETDAVVKGQPVLVGSLRRSMARILALANEVVGPEDDCEGALMSALPTRGKGGEDASTEESTSSPESNDAETSTSDSSISSSTALTLKTPQPSITIKQPPFTFPPAHSLPAQIFGHGWLGTTPASPPTPADMVPAPSQPIPQDSFAHRLAKESLEVACLFLGDEPHVRAVSAPEARIFSNPMRGRARDEMLTRLRWLLGPGRKEMYRVVDLPYGRYAQHVYSRMELNPAMPEDIEWPWPSQPAGSRITPLTQFFSVAGLEKQLIALGVRVIDTETLELNLAGPQIPSIAASAEVSRQPESWSFVNCFSFPAQPRPGPSVVTVRLSVTLLVASLARRSVCLMRGPGIPRNEVGSAIEEAIIST